MTSITLRYIAPAVAFVCFSSNVAFATEPTAADGAAPATGDAPVAAAPAAAAPAPAAAPAKKDESDPKDRPAPNTIYAELAGAALIYSINYERRVIDDLGVRLGFCFFASGGSASGGGASVSSSYKYLAIPITASYLGIRSGKHGLELGGGVTIRYETAAASANTVSGEASATDAYGVVMVGYRYHPVAKAGFNFRIGAMALAGKRLNYIGDNPNDFGVLPFGYLSLGGSF
jgi:hypothetical protein